MQAEAAGSFDGFKGDLAYGWLWQPGMPDYRSQVVIEIDGAAVGNRTADIMRADLLEAGVGDGRHGFEFRLPGALDDRQPHSIAIIEAGTGRPLPFSPRVVSTSLYVDQAALYAGAPWIDQADGPQRAWQEFQAGNVSYADLRRLDCWHENGYVLLPGAVDPELIEQCNAHVDALLNDRLKVLFTTPSLPPTAFDEIARPENYVGARFLEFHTVSQAATQLAMHPDVLRFLNLIFDDVPVCMQSLLFIQGTEQRAHTDYPYVHTRRPAVLAASWIALDDVTEETGPIFFYPGSHRLVPPYDFGFGNVLAFGNGPHVRAFENYLQDRADTEGLERKTLLARKGDLMIWHAGLVHGGSPMDDPAHTQRSLLTHFSAQKVYSHDRRYPDDEPIVRSVNGGIYYDFKPGTYPTGALKLPRPRG